MHPHHCHVGEVRVLPNTWFACFGKPDGTTVMIGRRIATSGRDTAVGSGAVGRRHGSARRYQPIASRTPVITNCTAIAASSRPMIRVMTRIPVCPIFTTSRSPTRSVSQAMNTVRRIEP